jgi:hypothetical protein
MLIYLAGGESRHWLHNPLIEEKHENISCRRSSVEGGQDRLYDKATAQHKPYILESFYYADADTERLLPYYGDFLLDSGAFTFMMSSKNHVVWEEYIERYANFINRNNVKKFFELDIDSYVVGDFINDKIFAKMKEKHPEDSKGFSFRAIISSIGGNFVDSFIFLPLAFFGEMPIETLAIMCITQVGLKTAYETIMLPVTNLVVNLVNRKEKQAA